MKSEKEFIIGKYAASDTSLIILNVISSLKKEKDMIHFGKKNITDVNKITKNILFFFEL